MKQIRVKIIPNSMDLPFFQRFIIHPNDKDLFTKQFENVSTIIDLDQQPSWCAWDVLRSNGWINDGLAEEYYLFLMPETNEEKLELLLKHHDWYFEMSDNNRYYSSGRYILGKIQRLIYKVGEPTVTQLWDKYAPKDIIRG
jgi:hypothetical protein